MWLGFALLNIDRDDEIMSPMPDFIIIARVRYWPVTVINHITDTYITVSSSHFHSTHTFSNSFFRYDHVFWFGADIYFYSIAKLWSLLLIVHEMEETIQFHLVRCLSNKHVCIYVSDKNAETR